MKYIKLIVPRIILILISIQVVNASANDEQQVYQQVTLATDNILAVLVDPTKSKSAKSDAIFTIANSLIDFDLMAKLSIGSSGWEKLSSDQKDEYLSLFVERIRALYLKTIFAYSKQEIIVEKAEKYKSRRISISTYIRDNNENIELLYKFYRNKENLWQAYDIRVDGVSILQIERSQYKELLETYTVDDFLKKLKQNSELRKTTVHN
jgi:phospholipid transport system substrate-binding protein